MFQLGQGKYSIVYCMELDNDRKVAIKVLKPAYEKNKYFQDQLIREAKIGMQLHHPSIRRVKDLIHDDVENTYQIMMEFVDGYNMKDYITNFGPINEKQVIDWLKFFIPGLIEAHRSGNVHGLLKPGNFILNPMGKLKICDFKGPYFESELFPEDIDAEDIIYLSPEQIQHIGPISAASDIYSLGATIFTLLTGKVPFWEENIGIDEIRLRILNDPLPFVEHATVKMNSVIQAATAKNPKERYVDLESLMQDLDEEFFIKQSSLFSKVKKEYDEAHNDVAESPERSDSDKIIDSKFTEDIAVSDGYSDGPGSVSDERPKEVTFGNSDEIKVNSGETKDSGSVLINEIAENLQSDKEEGLPSLEDRVQAVWNKIGVATNAAQPVVDKVHVIQSKKNNVKADKSDGDKEVKTPEKKLAVRTVKYDPEIGEEVNSGPETQIDINKNIKNDSKKIASGDEVSVSELPVIDESNENQVISDNERSNLKANNNSVHQTVILNTPEPSINKGLFRKPLSNKLFLGIILGIGIIGGGLYLMNNFDRKDEPAILFNQEDSLSEDTQPVPSELTENLNEVQQQKVDSLINSDTTNSLIDLEKAKLEKLAEISRLRKQKEKEAEEMKALKDAMSKFEILGPYNNNIAPFKYNDLIGFVSKDGKIIKKPVYDEILGYSNGLAPVNLKGKWGFVNYSGKEVIKPQYNEIFGFSKGVAGAKKGLKWGFIKSSGQVAVPFRYDVVTDFAEGLSGVRKNGKWGFVNKNGTEVIPCQFDNAWSFNNGLAGVEKNDKWGFINNKGKIVIPLEFGQVNNFMEGMSCVEKNGKFGFINKDGKEVIRCQYDAAKPFKNGTARVFDYGKWFYINKAGKCVRDCN